MTDPDHKPWYQLSSTEALERLGSSPEGLPVEEARSRIERYGFNELKIKKPSAWMRLLRQFHNALVYILLVAIVLTSSLALAGDRDYWMDTAVIAAVVILNVIIGFFQVGKAEASLEALTSRDVKGLYKKAIAGEIKNFTGVSDPYEPPPNPEVTVYTDKEPIEESLARILDYLRSHRLV